MCTLLARAIEVLDGLSKDTQEEAKEIFCRLVLPHRIDGSVVDRYVRKAMRSGIWRSLSRESRALLIVLRRWGLIRSQTLKSILKEIFFVIETSTLRGKAILYGITHTLKYLTILGKELLSSVNKLLLLGIQYINNPLIYRI